MRWLIASLLLTSALTGCEGEKAPPQVLGPVTGEGSASFKIAIPLAVRAGIARVEAIVEAPDMPTIRRDLTLADTVATGTIGGIPSGSDRRFTINGYDAGGVMSYTGADTATVYPNTTVTVSLTLERLVGVVEVRASWPSAGTDAEEIAGLIQLPGNPVPAYQSLSVVSPVGEARPEASGRFSVSMPTAEKQQFVVVTDHQTGNPVLLGYRDPSIGEQLDVSYESTAIGIVTLNPLMLFTSAEQRRDLVAKARNHPRFQVLTQMLEAAYQKDMQTTLDYAVHPEIYQQAAEILLDVLKQFGGKVVVEEDTPWIEDLVGAPVSFVNPKMVYYAAGVYSGELLRDVVTVEAKPSLVTVHMGLPPVLFTPSQRTDYILGDGSFDIYMTKGFRFDDLSTFFDPDVPNGRANLLNMATGILMVVDLTVGYMPTAPFSQLRLTATETAYQLSQMAISFKEGDQWELISHFVELVGANTEAIAYWLWQDGATDGTQRYLKAVSGVVKNGALVLKILSAANIQAPFFWDLIFAKSEVQYSVAQTNGVLVETAANSPPTAAFTLNPTAGIIGTDFRFDASASTDHEDGPQGIYFRWDWDSDGEWDTSWSTEKTSTHAFTKAGAFVVVLEVQDTQGLTSIATRRVNVGGGAGTATHIKLFMDDNPWESASMFSMFLENNIVEGVGKDTYERLASESMRNVGLEPGVDMVIICNDQTQSFYDMYAENQVKFMNFVNDGGTILWEAADRGWNSGSIAAAGIVLPGGIVVNYQPEGTNVVADNALPLVAGLPQLLTGTQASHEWFSNLPDGVTVYTTGYESGQPTLIEYNWGAGWVIMTGQPLEYNYDRRDVNSSGALLSRVVRYVLGKSPSAKIGVARWVSPMPFLDLPSSASRRRVGEFGP